MENNNTFTQKNCPKSALVQEYLVYLREKKSRSEMTLDSYDKDLSQFVTFLESGTDSAPSVCDEQMLQLSSQRAQEFVDHLIAQQFTVSTIGRKVTAVRGLYKYLQAGSRVTANPFEHSYVPQRHVAQVEYLQPDQLRRLFESIACDNWLGLRDRAIIALLYNTGMRVSELLSLTSSGIDLENAVVTIQISGHKTRTSRLQEWVVNALNRYLESRRLRSDDRSPDRDYVFVNRDGGLLTARSIRRKLKHYSQQAELPIEAGPAILRHSCAMHMLMDGADVKAVRQQLGHLSASSMRPYIDCLQHQQAPKEPAAQPCVPA